MADVRITQGVRRGVCPLLEIWYLDLYTSPALPAHNVVMMTTAVAAAIDELAFGCLQCIELAVLCEKSKVAVHGGQSNRFTGCAELGVNVLRASEVL